MKKTAGAVPTAGGKFRVGIVVARFNQSVTEKLLEGAERKLREMQVKSFETIWVPGAFEIPIMLQTLARSGQFDALIALGAVIRGETPHFDYVCQEASRGVMEVSLQEELPIAFGVLTTDTMEQALDRIGGKHGHKGEEAALVALEMAALTKEKPRK